MVENLLKTKGGKSCTKRASTKNKLREFLNEHVLFNAVFSSVVLFESVITGAKIVFFFNFLDI